MYWGMTIRVNLTIAAFLLGMAILSWAIIALPALAIVHVAHEAGWLLAFKCAVAIALVVNLGINSKRTWELAPMFEPKYPRHAAAVRVTGVVYFIGPLALMLYALFLRA